MSTRSTVDDISCLAWRFKHFKRRMLKSLPFHLRNMAGLHISDKASSPSKNFVDQIFSSKDLCPIGRLLISSSVDIWWYIMIFWCFKMCFVSWTRFRSLGPVRNQSPGPRHSYLQRILTCAVLSSSTPWASVSNFKRCTSTAVTKFWAIWSLRNLFGQFS